MASADTDTTANTCRDKTARVFRVFRDAVFIDGLR